MEYDNSKQVIVSAVTSDNPKAPVIRVEFMNENGEKQKAGVWLWTRKDGSPVLDKDGKKRYIGNYEPDTYAEKIQSDGIEDMNKAFEPEKFADDDIPF